MTIATCVHVLAPGQPACTEKEFDGLFRSDCAYVVQVAQESGVAGKLYLWSGKNISKKIKQRSGKQASEVAEAMQTKPEIVREQQGEESAEFCQLWSSLRYVDAENNEHTTDEKEITQPDEAPAALEEVAEEAAENGVVAQEDNAKEVIDSKGSEKIEENGGSPPKDAVPIAKPAAEPTSDPAPAVDPTPAGKEPSSAQSPPPQATSPAVGGRLLAEQQPKLGEEAPKLIVATPPSKQLETPKAHQASSEGLESVAKTRELLTKRLSGSFTDPMHRRQSTSGSTTPKGSATTYLADAAKVWGAPLSAENSGSNVAELKYIPLQDTFPYEELKGMRSDSGIDMTRKEDYLGPEEFAKVFGKEREAFKAQPLWRQHQAKKQMGLF